jgi:hypothetical protein
MTNFPEKLWMRMKEHHHAIATRTISAGQIKRVPAPNYHSNVQRTVAPQWKKCYLQYFFGFFTLVSQPCAKLVDMKLIYYVLLTIKLISHQIHVNIDTPSFCPS